MKLDSDSLCITLTDNGSLRPEATLSLQRLAQGLSERVARRVHPVSLLHSNKVPATALQGEPAAILESFVLERRKLGIASFLVVPLFFGPSAAIAEYLPQRVDAIREAHDWPELTLRVAPCLVDVTAPADFRMARILADLVEAKMEAVGVGPDCGVALIDHGSPRPAVTEVRNFLARQLRQLLGTKVAAVEPCSMERRDGPAYDFNEPLLERLLGTPGFDREVVVSLQFLQPGGHAGPEGDVATICREAERVLPGLQTHRTDLVGRHPALLDLLTERLETGLSADPVSWKAMMVRE